MGGKTSGPVAPSEALHLRGIPHYLKKPQQNTFAPMPILVRAGGAQGRGWDGGQVRPPSSSRPRPCTPPLSCCAPAAPSFSTSGWGSRCIHSLCISGDVKPPCMPCLANSRSPILAVRKTPRLPHVEQRCKGAQTARARRRLLCRRREHSY